jgi:fructose/tagatose bisphosphate aldolase
MAITSVMVDGMELKEDKNLKVTGECTRNL